MLVPFTETASIEGAEGSEADEGTEKIRFGSLLYPPMPAIAITDLSVEGGQPHLHAN